MSESTAVLASKAAAWGVLSAISLVIGAVIGVMRNPRKEVRAMLMAYGSGALIEALSIELFAHIVHMAQEGESSDGRRLSGGGPGKPLVYVAMAMAILGGCVFAGLNKVLNEAGGFARHATSLKDYVGKRRLIFYARLASKLKSVPMLAKLEMGELRALASKMQKDTFMEGESVFHHEDLHPPMYFLMSGLVRVNICHGQEQRSDLPLASTDADAVKPFDVSESSPKRKVGESEVGESSLHVVGASEDSYQVEPHQLFGELSLLTGQPLRANATAATDITVLKLLSNDFIDLVEENDQIRQFLEASAGRSMNNTNLFDEASMENLIQEMELIVFGRDDTIYLHVDETTPVYYLVLGHVWLNYESAKDAFPSRQDKMQTSRRRIIRPGKLFGTDNLLKGITGASTSVTAVAHDRSLVLCLHRADITRLKGLSMILNMRLTAIKTDPPKPPQAQEFPLPGSISAGGGGAKVHFEPAQANSQDPPVMHVVQSIHSEVDDSLEKAYNSSDDEERGIVRKRRTSKRVSSKAATWKATGSQASRPEIRAHSKEVTDEEVLKETEMAWSHDDADGSANSAEGGHHNSHAAMMIWLGILIDAVPESVVLGILSSTSSSASLLTFVIGVFLANLPEAMSSSGTMAACGIGRTRILTMWSSIVVLTGVGAGVGAVLFPPGSEDEASSQYAIAAIEGMCGGAMLTMIANTALPEAFEQGGNVVGLSCLMGFLSALFVSVASS